MDPEKLTAPIEATGKALTPASASWMLAAVISFGASVGLLGFSVVMLTRVEMAQEVNRAAFQQAIIRQVTESSNRLEETRAREVQAREHQITQWISELTRLIERFE